MPGDDGTAVAILIALPPIAFGIFIWLMERRTWR
jgi:hypothetical protein